MRWLLVSSQRKRNKCFESLIIVQRVELCKTLLQNFKRVTSWRSSDEVEDLSSYILKKTGHSVVKLRLGYCIGFDGKLRISLIKPNLNCVGPEIGKLQRSVCSYGRELMEKEEK